MDKNKILEILEERFKENMHLHKDIEWEDVETLLSDSHIKTLSQMEEAQGEPDVIKLHGELYYVDTVKETVEERGNITYDQKAQDSRAKQKLPIRGNAKTIVEEMGAELLTEEEYHELQKLDDFDLKTSVWLETPEDVRKAGGALFGDKRYGRSFIYHNGAQSFYKVRGYRSKIKL